MTTVLGKTLPYCEEIAYIKEYCSALRNKCLFSFILRHLKFISCFVLSCVIKRVKNFLISSYKNRNIRGERNFKKESFSLEKRKINCSYSEPAEMCFLENIIRST